MIVTILFDEENQQNEIALIKKWNLNHHLTYIGYTIKDKQLDLVSLDETEIFVILIGISTKFLSTQFTERVKSIIGSTKAILCLNINGFIGLNEDDCPRMLWDCGALHMPFDEENVRYSLNVIKLDTRIDNSTGSFHFRKDARPFDIE